MVTSRSILGDTVTAYEITPNGSDADPKPAERDDETVRRIYQLLLAESHKLTRTIKSANSPAAERNFHL